MDPTGHFFEKLKNKIEEIKGIVGEIVDEAKKWLNGFGTPSQSPPDYVTGNREVGLEEGLNEGVESIKTAGKGQKIERGRVLYKVEGKYYLTDILDGGEDTIDWYVLYKQIQDVGGTMVYAFHSHPSKFLRQNIEKNENNTVDTVTGGLSSLVDARVAGNDSYKFMRVYTICEDYEEYIDAAKYRKPPKDYRGSFIHGRNYTYDSKTKEYALIPNFKRSIYDE